jgi:threonyl-tRNA synthetase
LKEIAQERGAEYYEAPGEAAMYGPKIDFIAKDSIGREHQVATIQLDMNLPERFDLSCKNEKGEDERIVMIHAAIMGSIERFTAVLIEHLAGVFPLWLAPVQVRVLPIAESHKEYAQEVFKSLKNADIRAELDSDDETLGKKIRNAKLDKLPYFLVIGDKEVTAKTATVESRAKGNEGAMSVEELVEKFKQEIKEKK